MNTPTPPAAAAPPAAKPVEKKLEGFKMKNPCMWHILPLEDDNIEAICHETAEKFTGSIKEFNARLKG
jgi:hypothetical protein